MDYRIILPYGYKARFQRTVQDTGNGFKTIEELHEADRKISLKKHRIKL